MTGFNLLKLESIFHVPLSKLCGCRNQTRKLKIENASTGEKKNKNTGTSVLFYF